MNKRMIGCRALALAVGAALLVSCAAPAAKTGAPTASATKAPVRTDGGNGLGLPVETAAKASPKPLATPPPQGLQHALPQPTPQPTARPADAPMTADDYYPVTVNGRDGIVDRNGKVVVPFKFADISFCLYDTSAAGAEEMFLCTPVQAGPANAKRRYSGYLYNAEGKMVTSVRLSSADVLGPDLIEIQKAKYGDYVDDSYDEEEDSDGSLTPAEANVNGAILYSGKLVIPYKYMEIFQFGKAAAAVRLQSDNKFGVDIYDLKGNLLRTVTVPQELGEDGNITDPDVKSCGSVLKIADTNGKYGLLNDRLQWVTPEQWDNIELDEATGQYIVTKAGYVGVMDMSGQLIIPATYIPAAFSESEGGDLGYTLDRFYTFYDGKAVHVFDSTGKDLMKLEKYTHLEYSNGIIIAANMLYGKSVAKSDLYDLQGNLLLSLPDNITAYYPEAGYFQADTTFYNSYGEALPLPAGSDVMYVTPNRFIVFQQDSSAQFGQRCGLCDAQGNWIIQPGYANLSKIGGNLLLYDQWMGDNFFNEDAESNDLYGLIDLDGNKLTGPVFYSFDGYWEDMSLYYVSTATERGLMDSNLKWVWKTTIFDQLDED